MLNIVRHQQLHLGETCDGEIPEEANPAANQIGRTDHQKRPADIDDVGMLPRGPFRAFQPL